MKFFNALALCGVAHGSVITFEGQAADGTNNELDISYDGTDLTIPGYAKTADLVSLQSRMLTNFESLSSRVASLQGWNATVNSSAMAIPGIHIPDEVKNEVFTPEEVNEIGDEIGEAGVAGGEVWRICSCNDGWTKYQCRDNIQDIRRGCYCCDRIVPTGCDPEQEKSSETHSLGGIASPAWVDPKVDGVGVATAAPGGFVTGAPVATELMQLKDWKCRGATLEVCGEFCESVGGHMGTNPNGGPSTEESWCLGCPNNVAWPYNGNTSPNGDSSS
jgi:hypothetical protein